MNTINYGRLAEVQRINTSAINTMKSATNRDLWYINSLVDLNSDIEVTDKQKQEIIEFWKPYEFAYKNNIETQIAFYKQSGVFDPSYIGFGLQRHSLVRFWNNETFSTFRNKNYSRLLFPFLKHPINYVSNSYGVYYDKNNKLLTKEESIKKIIGILEYEDELILKPVLDSGSGVSIVFLYKNMDYKTIEQYFDKLKENFVCQQVLKNHISYVCGNEKALHTLRVCTLVYKNEIRLVGTVLRMSVSGRLDNWGQGGLICRVYENGVCGDFAVSEKGKKFYQHPNGFAFAGHKLYKADEVQKIALKCHAQIPQQKYISWDLTVDDNGDIVFIEMNSPGGSEVLEAVGVNAYCNKEIAKSILDEYMIEKFFYNKAVYEWDYREFNNHISLRRYCGDDEMVTIPTNINGKTVRIVYSDAFIGCKIKQINVPPRVHFDSKLVNNDIKVVYEK